MTEGVELRFWASVHSVETGEETHLATFYLLNTSLNRNNWRVTDKALEDALPTLLGKPLGCIPGYRVNHVHQPLQVGKWIRVDKPDGYALATAEISDPVAWERLSSGEWGPVSVVIRAFKVTCSRCGADITGAPDEHVASMEGHEVIESFVFDRVDFVSEPAYPQAGILTIGHLAQAASEGVLYASRSNVDGAQGPQGADPKPEEKRENKKMEEKIAELQSQLEQLRTEKQHTATVVAGLQENIEQLQSENQELKEDLQRRKAERHQELLNAATEARLRAGLVRDREAEAQRLKELDDGTLILLAEDADQVAEKLAKAPPTGPKAKYTGNDKSTFEAAVDDMREQLFGYRKEAGR